MGRWYEDRANYLRPGHDGIEQFVSNGWDISDVQPEAPASGTFHFRIGRWVAGTVTAPAGRTGSGLYGGC